MGGRTVLLDRINNDLLKDVKTLMLIALILMMGFCISFQAKAWGASAVWNGRYVDYRRDGHDAATRLDL